LELLANLIAGDQSGLEAQQSRGIGCAEPAEFEALSNVCVTARELCEMSVETCVELPDHRPELMRDLPEFAERKALPIRRQMFIEAGICEAMPGTMVWRDGSDVR
jgi:hypothetical protein